MSNIFGESLFPFPNSSRRISEFDVMQIAPAYLKLKFLVKKLKKIFDKIIARSSITRLFILGNICSHTLKIGDITIKSASSVTLLGMAIDSKLNFKEHINNIVKKTYYKLYALRRLKSF